MTTPGRHPEGETIFKIRVLGQWQAERVGAEIRKHTGWGTANLFFRLQTRERHRDAAVENKKDGD